MYGISLLALLLLGGNFLVSGMMMQNVGKVAVDMALSTISFAGLLLVFFVGINLLAKDFDRKTVYMVLSRPVSRSQYIFGKFLGLFLLVTVAVVFLSVCGTLSIFLVKITFPTFFERFSWPLLFLAFVYIEMMLVLLVALSFLFASFASTSFITLILTIVAYLIGHVISDVKELVASPQVAGIEVSSLTKTTVDVAYYLFPNLSFFDLKLQAAHGIAVSGSYILWTSAYFVLYVSICLVLAAAIFQRREFP
jgi:ABC-type transport system involved in multi-copper enzyme maturation permease subunit